MPLTPKIHRLIVGELRKARAYGRGGVKRAIWAIMQRTGMSWRTIERRIAQVRMAVNSP